MIKKAKFWANILGPVYGVEAIFLSGSIATNNYTKYSDIDFLIITKYNHIWTARFFVFFLLKIFKQLAKSDNHAGKICPNHFITNNSLKIKEKNAYSAFLFTHNIPLYDPNNLFYEFININKKWVQNFNESFSTNKYTKNKQKRNTLKIVNKNWLEQFLKYWQIKKIKNNSSYYNSRSCIILKDTELRFHPVPKSHNWKKPL